MNDEFDEMDRYFGGRMSAAEKEAFEKRYQEDDMLADELALYITIHDHIKQQWLTKRKQELAMLEQELEMPVQHHALADVEPAGDTNSIPGKAQVLAAVNTNDTDDQSPKAANTGRPKRHALFNRLAAAAVLLACIVFTITWYQGYQSKQNQFAGTKKKVNAFVETTDTALPGAVAVQPKKPVFDTPLNNNLAKPGVTPEVLQVGDRLFAENFTMEPPPAGATPELENALAFYEQKKYPAAIAEFDRVQDQQLRGGEMTDDEELNFFYIPYFKAQIYLSRGNTDRAITELQSAIKRSPSEEYKAAANWYLALAYLKQENTNQAKALLRALSQNSSAGAYRAKAKKLLLQL